MIEAVQWDGTEAGAARIQEWIGDGADAQRLEFGGGVLDVVTLEGCLSASPGDWIIRGVKGEVYPCKPDIFEATYEPVDGAR